MTRKEAVIAMLEGKKVMSIGHHKDYMYFDTYLGFMYRHSHGMQEPITTALKYSNGYSIYNEITCDGKEVVIDGKKYKLTEVK